MKRFRILIILSAFLSYTNAQDCADLFISEVIEGSGNNKAIEIYNPTNEIIDLADYVVKRYSNGSTTAPAGYTTDLVGTIQPYGTFILVNGQTESTETSPACDPVLQALAVGSNGMLDGEYPAPMFQNGNDAFTIEKKNGVIVDIFGKIGEDPMSGWYDQDSTNYSAGEYWWLAWTANHTLIRKSTVLQGVTVNPGSTVDAPEYFNPAIEWDTLPKDTWDSLGFHDCDCNSSLYVEYLSGNPSCNSYNDGYIDITPHGGTEPYTFEWSNGATSEDLNFLLAGTYIVTVTDYENYNYSKTFVLTEPEELSAYANTDTICYNESNGYLEIIASGGTMPYQFFWNDSLLSTNLLNNIPVGNYTITILDSNSCEYTDSFNVYEFPEIQTGPISGSTEVELNINYIYSVEDTPNSSYFWAINKGDIITGQGTNIIAVVWTESGEGELSVIETSINDCYGQLVDTTVQIASNTSLYLKNNQNFIVYPNPTNGLLFIKSKNQKMQIINYELINTLGEVVAKSSNLININETIDLSEIPMGNYILKLFLNNRLDYIRIVKL